MMILIDNGHGNNTAGKCSPDRTHFEFEWTREIAKRLEDALKLRGYQATRITTEQKDITIAERCRRVNAVCAAYGNKNCLLVSIHNNAAGSSGHWLGATGWSVYVSKNASSNSKRLAQLLYAEAERLGLQGNRSVSKEKYWVQDLGICRDTKCPAVLTENLFMDNRADLKILQSEDGKDKIVELHVEGIIKYIKEVEK